MEMIEISLFPGDSMMLSRDDLTRTSRFFRASLSPEWLQCGGNSSLEEGRTRAGERRMIRYELDFALPLRESMLVRKAVEIPIEEREAALLTAKLDPLYDTFIYAHKIALSLVSRQRVDLSALTPSTASETILTVVDWADAYDALPALADSIAGLILSSPNLGLAAIAERPCKYLRAASLLRSVVLYQEAMRHAAGSPARAERPRMHQRWEDLGGSLKLSRLVVAERKKLHARIEDAKRALLRIRLRMGQTFPSAETEAAEKLFREWLEVAVFKACNDREPAKPWRQLYDGVNMPGITNGPWSPEEFPAWKLPDLEAWFREMYGAAREIVKPLFERGSVVRSTRVDAYFTCLEFADHTYPWEINEQPAWPAYRPVYEAQETTLDEESPTAGTRKTLMGRITPWIPWVLTTLNLVLVMWIVFISVLRVYYLYSLKCHLE